MKKPDIKVDPKIKRDIFTELREGFTELAEARKGEVRQMEVVQDVIGRYSQTLRELAK